MTNVRALEDLIIEAIYAGEFDVLSFIFGRDLSPNID